MSVTYSRSRYCTGIGGGGVLARWLAPRGEKQNRCLRAIPKAAVAGRGRQSVYELWRFRLSIRAMPIMPVPSMMIDHGSGIGGAAYAAGASTATSAVVTAIAANHNHLFVIVLSLSFP